MKPFQAFHEQEQHCRGLLGDQSAFFLVAHTVKVDLLLPKSGEQPQSLLLPSQSLEGQDWHWSVSPSLPAPPAPCGKAVCHECLCHQVLAMLHKGGKRECSQICHIGSLCLRLEEVPQPLTCQKVSFKELGRSWDAL